MLCRAVLHDSGSALCAKQKKHLQSQLQIADNLSQEGLLQVVFGHRALVAGKETKVLGTFLYSSCQSEVLVDTCWDMIYQLSLPYEQGPSVQCLLHIGN